MWGPLNKASGGRAACKQMDYNKLAKQNRDMLEFLFDNRRSNTALQLRLPCYQRSFKRQFSR